jgi:hypothetical protein
VAPQGARAVPPDRLRGLPFGGRLCCAGAHDKLSDERNGLAHFLLIHFLHEIV